LRRKTVKGEETKKAKTREGTGSLKLRETSQKGGEITRKAKRLKRSQSQGGRVPKNSAGQPAKFRGVWGTGSGPVNKLSKGGGGPAGKTPEEKKRGKWFQPTIKGGKPRGHDPRPAASAFETGA